MDRIRWAVLGAGGIARRRTIPEGIIPAPDAVLTAVYDPACGEEVASQFGAKACRSEDELLAEPCDAVYVATPVHLHCEQVIRAAAAGRHVLCEKPLGLSPAQAERMVAACEQSKVKLGVGLLMRFHACHREAQRLVREGRLGRPILGRAQLSCWYPPIEGAWRQDPASGGGGSLMDMGCHCIDLLEMLLGPTRRVFCSTGRLVHDYRSEDTAVVLLEFASGARGVVDTLFNVPDSSSRNRLEVYGSAGSLLTEGTIGQGAAGTLQWLSEAEQDQDYNPLQQRAGGNGTLLSPPPVNTYRAQIEAFSAAVRNNTAPPVDGRHGLWNQRIVAACYESARTGSPVTIQG
jgi:predicted dehydrogenase